MDPFFDDHDEEENVPDSAFGPIPVPGPNRSQESQLPLSRNVGPLAGAGSDQSQALPQDWNFDDEDFMPSNAQAFPGTSNYPPPQKQKSESFISRLKKQKWPWITEKTLTGERVVALNNSAANVEFCSNHVSTSKYNFVTFLPKFLFGKRALIEIFYADHSMPEQFSKYANLFFLFTACIQQIPGVSPTNRYTTIAPLAVVLLVSAFKEVQEDLVIFVLTCLISYVSLPKPRNDINPTVNLIRGRPKF